MAAASAIATAIANATAAAPTAVRPVVIAREVRHGSRRSRDICGDPGENARRCAVEEPPGRGVNGTQELHDPRRGTFSGPARETSAHEILHHGADVRDRF
jgi:hypothetical protein